MYFVGVKVLVFAEWYPHSKAPTLGIFVQRMVAALVRFYPDTELVLVHPLSQKELRQIELVERDEYGYKVISALYPRRKTTLAKYFCYRAAMKQAADLAQENLGGIDLIWCQVGWRSAIMGYYLSRKLKVPYIISEHWTGYSTADGSYEKFSMIVRSWIARLFMQADSVVAVSESQLADLKSHFSLSQTQVIGNVVEPISRDLSQFPSFTFIHISTLSYQKNIPLLLSAFKLLQERVPEIELLILGGTMPKVSRLQRYVQKSKLKGVTCKGLVEESELIDYLSRSHALVHTSRFESFSVVIAEAWSAGIPTVATASGGLTDQIPDYAGKSVLGASAEAIAEAMFEVYKNYDLRDVAAIKNLAKQFEPESIARQYHQLFSRLTD